MLFLYKTRTVSAGVCQDSGNKGHQIDDSDGADPVDSTEYYIYKSSILDSRIRPVQISAALTIYG